MVFHVNMDGCILQNESDDFRDQQDYWETKRNLQKQLLSTMNKEVNDMEGGDPLQGDPIATKKSLRNQFNYQTRSSQTFNMPIRQKGFKTDPPQTSTYSQETTQWMIFDSYMQSYEDMQRIELEENLKSKKDKKSV